MAARRTRPLMVCASYGLPGELVIDSFAGGGGASIGLKAALGRPVDIAINHDPEAIAMHRANHPETRHYLEDVWGVDPREATGGRPVGLAWFSPDCTHFSRAKGQKPLKKEVRGLAWVVIRWAQAVKPRVIILENVPEFETWGPLSDDRRPCPDRRGSTFRKWLSKLRSFGYTVEWRVLVAADYGAPTIRKRLYLVARCDGQPIVWPEATHGPGTGRSHVQAHEILEWAEPCPSIFGRTRPLADATLRRIAEGIRRYVIGAREPFIVRHGHYSHRTGAGLRPGCGAGTWRGQSLRIPLSTVCATNDRHLVVPHVTKHYGGVVGHDVERSLGTITGKDHHALTAALLERAAGAAPRGERAGDVAVFLAKYYGSGGQGQDVRDPLHMVTGKARFALVEVMGEPHWIVDVGMRMLVPRELYRAQGFPDDYRIDAGPDGRALTKTAQIRMAGNSVCPPVAEALARANVQGVPARRRSRSAA